jgi:hypothetical protein
MPGTSALVETTRAQDPAYRPTGLRASRCDRSAAPTYGPFDKRALGSASTSLNIASHRASRDRLRRAVDHGALPSLRA